jgi:hypothetical protein
MATLAITDANGDVWEFDVSGAGTGASPYRFNQNVADGGGSLTVDGTVAATNTPLTNLGAGEYETVAASQTDQTLGATGAAGDYLLGLLIVPATTSPGAVSIKDGAGSAITVFTGGASSVSNLVPFLVPLGIISTGGAWKVSTGASVSAIGIGNFA